MAAEALSELEAAVELSGGEPRMRLAWAEGLAVTGDDLRAMGMLMGLQQTLTDPVLRDRADNLLGELRRLNAAREAATAVPAPTPDGARPPAGPPTSVAAPPTFRPVLPEGMSLREGRINYIGCLGSFQVVVVDDEGTLRLTAPDLTNVELASFTTAVSGEMPCGEIDPPLPARVIYRPSDGSDPDVDGTPVRIDFLP